METNCQIGYEPEHCLLKCSCSWSWLWWGWQVARRRSRRGRAAELSSLVREVMEHNPDIRAAQQRWMAAKTVIPQVRTLPDPWSTSATCRWDDA